MILFLDFDGVLHPEIHDKEVFCRIELLWEILRACPEVEVVFSTSWREFHPVDEMIDFATYGGGEDLAHRFIGTTPSIVREHEYTGQLYRREFECCLWLNGNGQQQRSWLAIDDFDSYFSPSCPTLYLIDHQMGLTKKDVKLLIERLAK